jgi:hypothetical protein
VTQPVKKKKTTLKDRWFYAGSEGTQVWRRRWLLQFICTTDC